MRHVVDTGTLRAKSALAALAKLTDDVVIPSIVLAERSRQLLRDGRDLARFRALLDEMDFEIEPFGEAESRYAMAIHDDAVWNRLARDAFIAGHVRDGDVLWTTNPKDFREIGVPAKQIRAVETPGPTS